MGIKENSRVRDREREKICLKCFMQELQQALQECYRHTSNKEFIMFEAGNNSVTGGGRAVPAHFVLLANGKWSNICSECICRWSLKYDGVE